MKPDKKRWYHNASRIFAVVCGILTVLLVLGVWFCIQDWQEALAAGEEYALAYMLTQGGGRVRYPGGDLRGAGCAISEQGPVGGISGGARHGTDGPPCPLPMLIRGSPLRCCPTLRLPVYPAKDFSGAGQDPQSGKNFPSS
ncbi:MAG: hypothetical protein LUD82_02440 [Clostridiales bacterium]|nr:hypothetical protein [Clostridiales bacterium]